MLPNASAQPQELLDERKPFLARLKANLVLARCDVMARRDGIATIQAVDFAAIFSYIYKAFEEDIVDRAPEERREQQYARLQVTLDVLFRSEDTCLALIPPFEEELRHHVQTMVAYEDRLKKANSLRDAYLDRIERALLHAPLFRHFVAAAIPRQSEGPAPAALIDAAVEVGKTYFPELYTLVRARTFGAMGLLKKLFDDHRLVRICDVLEPEALAFIEGQRQAVQSPKVDDGYRNPDEIDPWRSEIRKYRRLGRAYQTYTDAAACAYLVRANRFLNARKRMMTLITPSKHLKQATQSKPLEATAGSQCFSAVRDLDYFIIRTWGDTLESFEEPLRIVTDLEEQYASAELNDTATMKILEETNEKWKAIRKLQLVLDRYKVSYEDGVDRTRVNASFVRTLAVLLNVVREDETPFRDAVTDLTRESQSFLPIPVKVSTEIDNSVQIEFQGLPAEMPVTIRFEDKTVLELAAILHDAEKLRGSEFKQVRARIEQLAAAADSTPEQLLLAGYVFAMEARWEEAKLVLRRARTTAGMTASRAGIESHFLLGMIHRKLFEAEEAINHLREPILNKDEPRFNVEYANALWLYWHEIGKREGSQELDAAIAALEAVQDSDPDLDKCQHGLAVQLANLLAFLYTEKMAVGAHYWLRYQDSAARELERLTKLMPENWLARFHDTQGYFRLVSAIKSDNSQVAASLLDLAVRDFDRALADTQIVPRKRALIERHRNEARERLDTLRPIILKPTY